ncbi:two-component system chemotaxis sensor kinase CheA [Chromobacterium alkanivorans]|uniref:chemotaxis protein CheA n=1 Tax=Chromobacterium alkanivorans TaxID=1071719 RepID=UPI0019676BAD|nr:chemotaxis protein CheA [Chromobacterium alkanivorans]MBN3005630.1 chemotaxis protein CheA [Chromobacterium alkanivorans]MCS3806328.1 two-component system chemotaxis sensor kinase CheA [Chromobacterium alkanivorans]MCS3820660.1 two-component system chemotaxis sensor kinase CheA [Chromobacterium alkanivorans]MCS3875418.1 two-component system chemotaxis sensor kinase CheA [Chromobacterium alkanivorans]
MSEFAGMEELLQDFLMESTDLLSDVDNKLVELEKRPEDKALLNDIFRGFHTIKGGAGFLNVGPMINLCHRTENLFDKLRNGQLHITAGIMDVILDATGIVRDMFGTMGQGLMPSEADPRILAALDAALAGEELSENAAASAPAAAPAPEAAPAPAPAAATPPAAGNGQGPDWNQLYQAVAPGGAPAAPAAAPAAAAPAPQAAPAAAPAPAPLAAAPAAKPAAKPAPSKPAASAPSSSGPQENTIRIDTVRLDMVLNLSGEIGLTKNRLTTLRTEILQGNRDTNTLRSLDEAISQLDLLVGDLQNAVMKTRMQPIGRLFQKYPRLARDLARQLGKEVELVLSGEETELDKTMIEDLNDPLVHLVRNAVDHGIEQPEDRIAAGKKPQALVQLTAEQVGDHILIEITDDGKGMNADALRRKAIEKGLIDQESANSLDEKQCLQLIFLPGFSTKDQISSVSGRGVGMDVVRTNIQKLNGRIDINSVPGEGTRISISLPLTLAILPVLVVRACNQPFAVPLAMVREIITIDPNAIQEVSGKPTIVVRDEILPLKTLAGLLGWEPTQKPYFGVLMQSAEKSFILAIDSFVGRDDVVIKPLQNIRPKGVAGATLSGDGSVVLVLDMEDLLSSSEASNAVTRSADLIAT